MTSLSNSSWFIYKQCINLWECGWNVWVTTLWVYSCLFGKYFYFISCSFVFHWHVFKLSRNMPCLRECYFTLWEKHCYFWDRRWWNVPFHDPTWNPKWIIGLPALPLPKTETPAFVVKVPKTKTATLHCLPSPLWSSSSEICAKGRVCYSKQNMIA